MRPGKNRKQVSPEGVAAEHHLFRRCRQDFLEYACFEEAHDPASRVEGTEYDRVQRVCVVPATYLTDRERKLHVWLADQLDQLALLCGCRKTLEVVEGSPLIQHVGHDLHERRAYLWIILVRQVQRVLQSAVHIGGE